MTPLARKIAYAISFETLGILVEGLGLLLMSDASPGGSLLLAALLAAFAMTWSLVFNSLFEGWEKRQAKKGRSFWRRALHTLMFEGTLTLLLLPFLAWWLEVPLWQAAAYEAGLIAIFVVYTYLFTWAFDTLFGLPPSAR